MADVKNITAQESLAEANKSSSCVSFVGLYTIPGTCSSVMRLVPFPCALAYSPLDGKGSPEPG